MVDRYICEVCGEVFAEPQERTWYEDHGEGMRERWTALLCPFCGSEEIDQYYSEDD